MSLKCVRICALIFFVSLVRPLPLLAQQAGVSGLVQYTFQNDDYKNIGAETKKSSFIQEYDLSTQGDIYDPRLLQYDISGGFIKEDSKINESGIGETTDKAESRDYNVRLNFIQATNYPFTIYAEKFDRPAWTMQPEQIFQTRVTTDRYGLFGSDRLGAGTSLNYDFHQDHIKTSGQMQQTDQTDNNFLLGIDSRQGDAYVNASYSYQQIYEKVADRHEGINNARFSFGLKPGQDTRFNMDNSYYDNSFTKFTDTDSNANFNYMPSADFNSNLSFYASRIKQNEQSGSFGTVAGNAAYKINPFVTTTQDLMLYDSKGDFGNESTEALTLGLAFVKPLPDDITVSADTSANGTSQQSDKTQNRNSVYYTVDGRVSKLFNAVNSEVNGGGSYYSYNSSLGGRTTRYGYNAAFISRVIQNLTFQSLVDFSAENGVSDETNVISAITPTFIPTAPVATKTTYLIFDNSLAYVVQLGARASLDAKVGTISRTGTTPSTFSYGNSAIRYDPTSSLSLNAGLNYYKESYSSTTTLSSTVGVIYRLRSLTMNFQNDLWRQKGPQGVTTRSTTFLQVSRPF